MCKGLRPVPGAECPPSSEVALISSLQSRQAAQANGSGANQGSLGDLPPSARTSLIKYTSGGRESDVVLCSRLQEKAAGALSHFSCPHDAPDSQAFCEGLGKGDGPRAPTQCSDPPPDSLEEGEHPSVPGARAWGSHSHVPHVVKTFLCLLSPCLRRPKSVDNDEDTSNGEKLVKTPPALQRQGRVPDVWVCDGRKATGLSFPNAFIPWGHIRDPHPESGAIPLVSF